MIRSLAIFVRSISKGYNKGFGRDYINLPFVTNFEDIVNISLPYITGSPEVGKTLTGTNGSWQGLPIPSFSKQWKRDGVNISGATGTTYSSVVSDEGKEISFSISASNSQQSNIESSSIPFYIPYARSFTFGDSTCGFESISGATFSLDEQRLKITGSDIHSTGVSRRLYNLIPNIKYSIIYDLTFGTATIVDVTVGNSPGISQLMDHFWISSQIAKKDWFVANNSPIYFAVMPRESGKTCFLDNVFIIAEHSFTLTVQDGSSNPRSLTSADINFIGYKCYKNGESLTPDFIKFTPTDLANSSANWSSGGIYDTSGNLRIDIPSNAFSFNPDQIEFSIVPNSGTVVLPSPIFTL